MMKEKEERIGNAASQKEKIRQRYKGIDADELDVIPALPQTNFYEDSREKRVAVYARVSTDDPRQTSSYELQKNHYQDVVSRHPGWKLIEIYADATDIIGLKQNPTNGRRFSPIFSFIGHFRYKTRKCYF